MRRQLVALAAAFVLIAALVPSAAARSAEWTHYSWPNTGTQTFPWEGGFCGAVRADASGVTEEYDGPQCRQHRAVHRDEEVAERVHRPNGKTVTARVESVGLYTDTNNPAWAPYEGPWLFGWPQFQTVSEAGLLWSLVASDGARLEDSGAAITKWELGEPSVFGSPVLSENAVSLAGAPPDLQRRLQSGYPDLGCRLPVLHGSSELTPTIERSQP